MLGLYPLSVLLLPEAIPFVIGILPPLEDACDTLSWISTPTGIFYVASAYAHLLEPAWKAIDPKWSWVCSLAVTPRIHMFIWLILKQRLMTNEEHCQRGLSSDASSPLESWVLSNIRDKLVLVYKIGLKWAKHFAEINEVDRSPAASLVTYLQWTPPAPGLVCLNADAS
ncbi:hypothetical protein V6N12_037932 [Hibiscus sabdariffa]|uniref:Reverse transcriptase zinc-binding domain-containing protein n=1 Tax=Hibiscus sabdariffa TaxID=183260 RepID=A0ABR2AIY8_9ROSI